MEYIENGQEQNIDEKQLKQCLTEYYRSVKKLSELLHNSNIIGTYSEILVCAVLGLIKESDSHIGTDAKGADGKTYQIKSRWNKTFLGKNGQNEFGSFAYSTKKYPFDFLILVLVTFVGVLIFEISLFANIDCMKKSAPDFPA